MSKIDKQIEEKEKELKELKAQKLQEELKGKWLDIPEKGISILTELQYKGKTYPQILEEVNESEIADYALLQELRNEGFKSKWKKYNFLKDFSAFVPNPDEVSKSNGYVARFGANSGYAYLDCGEGSSYSYSGRGVFLIKKISNGKK